MHKFNLVIQLSLLLCLIFLSCSLTDDIDSCDDLTISIYASNLRNHQSAAVYGENVFLVTNRRTRIYKYDLVQCQMVDSIVMPVGKGTTPSGDVLYHCNQSSFSPCFYSTSDKYPLLFISQRAKEDKRCFAEVYRLLFNDNKYSAQLIQTILFPVMTEENSMGNVNVVFDAENKVMYTYSRNNDTMSTNYGVCKISKFTIPSFDIPIVYLNDEDIISSFSIECEAINMQGACIHNGVLYIGQGIKSPILRTINLDTGLLTTYNIKKKGCKYEPEGCFWYNESLMISTRKCIYKIDLSK